MKDKNSSQTVRAAIYTRKSTEEGLEQEFNSLDAQRESGSTHHPQPIATRATSQNKSRRESWGSFRGLQSCTHVSVSVPVIKLSAIAAG